MRGHIGRVCKKPKKKTGGANEVSAQVSAEASGEVASLSPAPQSPSQSAGFFFAEGDINKIGVSHHIHTAGAWRARKVKPHFRLFYQRKLTNLFKSILRLFYNKQAQNRRKIGERSGNWRTLVFREFLFFACFIQNRIKV